MAELSPSTPLQIALLNQVQESMPTSFSKTSVGHKAEVTIRAASPEDAATIKRFNLALLRETGRMSAYQIDRVRAGVDQVLSRPDVLGRYYIAELEGAPVGQLKIRSEFHDLKAREVWWVEHVFVTELCRGRGVFPALFQHVERNAREARIETILLRVTLNNQRAICAYERLGMSAEMYVMHKALSPAEADLVSHAITVHDVDVV